MLFLCSVHKFLELGEDLRVDTVHEVVEGVLAVESLTLGHLRHQVLLQGHCVHRVHLPQLETSPQQSQHTETNTQLMETTTQLMENTQLEISPQQHQHTETNTQLMQTNT